MATYANTSNQVAALKELYTGDDYMKDLVYKKNPFLALVPKDESPSGFAGKYIPVPLVYGTPQGRSATFASAQTYQTAPSLSSFFVYRVSNYQLVTITNELLEATKDNAGAFVDEAKLNMDTGFRNISNDLAHDLFSDGSGVRGQISAISGSGLITLVDAGSVVNFEVGMTLQSYNSSFVVVTAGALGYVIAVNRSAGTVQLSATAGGAAGLPTNWSTTFLNLVQQGDNPAAATATGTALKVTGLQGWLPTTSPSATSFWGVDRSVDPTRLGGVRYDGSSESIN